ncbi:hypothetical protein [Nocardia sp. NBC_01009]|uniref:hypothetical protein n=1 Tax=Nocardia sp. NBC_01009 TaxID=2975996 RepID=UPI003864C1E4|nr:hypothetical protein OHA42_24230 [Nocardia sp. NBC_01009]
MEAFIPRLDCPRKGYHLSDKPGRNTVHINLPLFEGVVENDIAMEITGIEMDTFDTYDKLRPSRRVYTGLPAEWLGSIGPGADPIEPRTSATGDSIAIPHRKSTSRTRCTAARRRACIGRNGGRVSWRSAAPAAAPLVVFRAHDAHRSAAIVLRNIRLRDSS